MFSALIILLVAMLTPGWCHKEFGCDFKDSNFRLKGKSDPVWGKPVEPMIFNSLDNFKSFLENVNEVIRKVFNENILDEMEEIISMKQAHESSGKSFESFYDKYFPTYEPRRDNLGLIIQVLRGLVKRPFLEVKDSSYIAAVDLSVNIDKYIRRKAGHPPSEFLVQHHVGIVKVKVSGVLGYVVIDMKNAVIPLPVIMDTDINHMDITTFYYRTILRSFGDLIKYNLFGEDKSYLHVLRHARPSPTWADNYIGSDMIYIEEPHCAFVITETRMLFQSYVPVRTLTKIGQDGYQQHFVHAKLYTFQNEAFNKVFMVGNINEDTKRLEKVTFDSLQNLSQNVIDALERAAVGFGMTKDVLIDKLTAVEDFIEKYMKSDSLWRRVKVLMRSPSAKKLDESKNKVTLRSKSFN